MNFLEAPLDLSKPPIQSTGLRELKQQSSSVNSRN